MQVLILGSGVIGTSVAYYLAKAGHEVTVLDRQPGPALETSYGNAGEVSPGYSAPWAGPGVPLKAVKWLLMRHSPLVIRPMLDPAMWRWGLSMLRNCTQARYELNKGRMVRLAEYSRDCLRELRADTGIHYDERSLGTLQLFRTQQQVDGMQKDIDILKAYGVPYQALDREGCIRYEPALASVREKFVGGLRLPGDETGDCFKFTQALAQLAEAAGVRFRFGTTIGDIAHDASGVTAVHTSAGPFHAERYVVALGSYSPRLLAPLGIRLPVYPVKGFSITVPIADASGAPESTVMDETFKVAVTRLG
ncbi:MAG: D-amino acid dehydrogenase, partial [Gammaproteobacteria bacterium]|nr:D-amino acid dehydrogenase [Gammaproteobacteria bacterium]